MPFFTYYGGKHRAAKHYPPPAYDVIVEPFAGAAGYSVNHHKRQVILCDLDPTLTETWRYLIGATPQEILALPDLEPDQTTLDLDVPLGARHLIGWWLNKGSAQPKLRPSTFMRDHPAGGPYWGQRIRERIAAQVPAIRHWIVVDGDYSTLPDLHATWFIDPPYQRAGKFYRHGSADIDYIALADWCRSRPGQQIVCEADDADWLPFTPLTRIDGTEGRQKTARARLEVVYLGTALEAAA
jgi:hypothetical protein